MKTIALIGPDNRSASAYYRQQLPLKFCQEELLKKDVVLQVPDPWMDGVEADFVVFYRVWPLGWYPVVLDRFITQKYTCWDIDDPARLLPWWNPAKKYLDKFTLLEHQQCLALSKKISVSTYPLMKEVAYQAKTTVLPNLVDMDSVIPRSQRDIDNPVILWAGGAGHDEDIRVMVPALREARKVRSDTEIVFYGHIPQFISDDTVIDATFIPWTANNNYYKVIHTISPDVIVSPLCMDEDGKPFNDCKSNIRYLEATLSGSVFMGQKCKTYECVRDGETGILCDTQEEWTAKMVDFLRNQERRRSVAYNAWEDVRANWSWQSSTKANLWLDYFLSLSESVS